ncbi:NADH-ubiquinone oxidoreductase-F iron-sulfur binding region domain-containing protein [Streptomyces erythrochromogenes]|uniref:NADH-ubiquinone oxidoreductase-F iron-sulfur binding region domain-containing protein n=1 Tax=Streptomyces erythrochromogenes TaxID=285574 RepID=UPI0022516B40|nr:NADH-ubiquinone oxidoreductase-F iron-sulfur binding region domain-containing protein [Streptomyces erythrochromogenes]MCX5583453.1 Fe-S-binding domain-containing protein [Streptomyces erythrochromogenes]
MTTTTIRLPAAQPPGTVLGTAPDIGESADAYRAAGGYGTHTGPGELLAHLAASDLRGRGGAGFPAAVKLRSVRDNGCRDDRGGRDELSGRPVVVANGEEGEPGSAKDRWLLRARPHLVLDGLARAAAVTGAVRGFVYLSDPAAGESVRRALAEHPPPLPVEVVETDHTYVAGEETAVVRRIDGGPALPAAKPPRPFEQGVGSAPTLVSNVETLARIALTAARPDLRLDIARGTLVTLSGGPAGPVLTEVPYGIPLRALASRHGVPDAAGALMGGLFGGLVDARALDLPLEPGALTAAGTALGCGAIRFLAPGGCPVACAADAAAHLAAESARQCRVCVSGSSAVGDALHALAAGTAGPDTADRLDRWSRGLRGRGACGLLDAAAGIAGSLLRAFPGHVRAHLAAPCPVCAAAAPAEGRHRLTVAVPEVAGPPTGASPVPLPARLPVPLPTALPVPLPALKGTP